MREVGDDKDKIYWRILKVIFGTSLLVSLSTYDKIILRKERNGERQDWISRNLIAAVCFEVFDFLNFVDQAARKFANIRSYFHTVSYKMSYVRNFYCNEIREAKFLKN